MHLYGSIHVMDAGSAFFKWYPSPSFFYLFWAHQTVHPGRLTVINMKPTNHPFSKEHDIPPPWLCSMLIFGGGKKRKWQGATKRTNTLLLLGPEFWRGYIWHLWKIKQQMFGFFHLSSCVWDYEHIESTLGEHVNVFESWLAMKINRGL